MVGGPVILRGGAGTTIIVVRVRRGKGLEELSLWRALAFAFLQNLRFGPSCRRMMVWLELCLFVAI